jgi:sporulation protein YlmC with PRC-barrel domain
MRGVELADVDHLSGAKVLDPNGEKVGKVADVLFDELSNKPRWVLVNVGKIGSRHTAVPLVDAYRSEEGDLVVAFNRDNVKHAPKVPGGAVLTTSEERHLLDHYGLDRPVPGNDGTVVDHN